MALPPALATAAASWADAYAHHQLVSVTVRYLHLAGLVIGGGGALVADRQLLRAARAGSPARAQALGALASSHRVVVPALAVMVTTGFLMTVADASTFLGSRLFWSKMGLVGLLLLNGVGLLRSERAAQRESPGAWRWLALASAASLGLWLTILFMGVWLTAAA